ncbi:hypothetical protein CEUSTIGMA_g2501.t1 [Chlamydomonas eustigma]|uniref:VLRF1 domain-containing protein n=1 Tax=Chlamydomonas eustigma TaxID=1157962 RepID=A0A250WW48_9CHLO|nr:hypothetical protein CEUSTIGMA_g2501.t1 [Chlamydomonas eustigma]|eukprot:GAX75057.1 hypothetical protein CEUSTIGMA_g2501.t1 [Chlamydomonas eustigma]
MITATALHFRATNPNIAVQILRTAQSRVLWDSSNRTWSIFDTVGYRTIQILWPRIMRRPASQEAAEAFIRTLCKPLSGGDLKERNILAECRDSRLHMAYKTPFEGQETEVPADMKQELLPRSSTGYVKTTSAQSTKHPSSSTASITSSKMLLQPCLMVLLSHDSAALGMWDSCGNMTHHKVLTGYTVRRCQGKAQDSRQRKGGGQASAGSALRQQETRRLWQDTAEKLIEWSSSIKQCERLYCSGDVRVWNLLYKDARPPALVSRADDRWERVGMSISARPRFKDLTFVYNKLCVGEIQKLQEN